MKKMLTIISVVAAAAVVGAISISFYLAEKKSIEQRPDGELCNVMIKETAYNKKDSKFFMSNIRTGRAVLFDIYRASFGDQKMLDELLKILDPTKSVTDHKKIIEEMTRKEEIRRKVIKNIDSLSRSKYKEEENDTEIEAKAKKYDSLLPIDTLKLPNSLTKKYNSWRNIFKKAKNVGDLSTLVNDSSELFFAKDLYFALSEIFDEDEFDNDMLKIKNTKEMKDFITEKVALAFFGNMYDEKHQLKNDLRKNDKVKLLSQMIHILDGETLSENKSMVKNIALEFFLISDNIKNKYRVEPAVAADTIGIKDVTVQSEVEKILDENEKGKIKTSNIKGYEDKDIKKMLTLSYLFNLYKNFYIETITKNDEENESYKLNDKEKKDLEDFIEKRPYTITNINLKDVLLERENLIYPLAKKLPNFNEIKGIMQKCSTNK